MKRRLLLHLLMGFVFLNPLFLAGVWANSDTYLWVGGYSNNWEDAQNWMNLDSMWTGELPSEIGDVMIDGNVSVVLSSNFVTGSIQLSGGATLTIAPGATLFTVEGGLNGSHGIRLDEVTPYSGSKYSAYLAPTNPGGHSTLIVDGTLVINDPVDPGIAAPGIGLLISQNTEVVVDDVNGSITIYNASDEAIKVKGGSLTSNGTISIINPNLAGIATSSGNGQYDIVNYGMLTITGGAIGLDLGSVYMDNYGVVKISGTSGKILDGSGNFRNYGVFGGNGTVGASDFFPQPGSVISPGTSIGTITFDSDLDLSGITLLIEINASNSYDRLIVQGKAILEGGSLNFGGMHSPIDGEDYVVVHSTTNQIMGKFSSPSEGEIVTLNSSSFTISYLGNIAADVDILINSSSALPVELTTFTAHPAGKEVELHWATATETNNDYFSIEHSTDGRHFREIGRVNGFGASQEPHEYRYVHYMPPNGLNYYRLGQHDFDGGHEYSGIETALIKGGEDSWTIRPTLAHASVTVEWVAAPGGDSVIEAFNLAGQKVYAHKAPTQSAKLQIPVESWAPGMYWVLVRNKGQVTAHQFIKD